jgi:two-component system, OmpR family, sensor histidine kinase BaeS
MPRAVALTYQGPADAPTVQGDPERLAQILANLLDNALRHTPPAGHVTVTLETRPRQVLLRVADDGTGIPPDQLEAIFERFHRGGPARPETDGSGSGLGLTIARTIAHAHAHAGTLTADSTGHGSTFTLTLPAT